MSAFPIPELTLKKQRDAARPESSVWVSAHAGSGKTYVLAQRVLRLLLSGATPSQILCLTYTKAAAANMSKRIFDHLAEWVVLEDAELVKKIEATGAPSPDRQTLDFARRLFARAVETPGGLKIQTIHAFCEKLLHIFPFEANVPAGFRVLDDISRAELIEASRRQTIEQAISDDGALHAALEEIARESSSQSFDQLCEELLFNRDALAQCDDPEIYAADLRATLGLRDDETLASLENEMIMGGEPPEAWPALADQLMQSEKKSDHTLAKYLYDAHQLAPDVKCLETYLFAFYTKDGAPRGVKEKSAILTKDFAAANPSLLARMENERDRLGLLIEKRKAAAVVQRSLALARLGHAILDSYMRAKRRRNLLDYDDLIQRTRGLLHRSSPSWVLYKLDAQIDHILLDEAQDTSAAQWDILTAITDEFSAGASARGLARSFFAVGDEKQSIFSFQGAAPEKFQEMRRNFERRFAAADRAFVQIALHQSFRSAQGILKAVDQVFAYAGNGVGLGLSASETMLHESIKTHVPALVEVWPLIGKDDVADPEDWRLPLDSVSRDDPSERMAGKVAARIAELLTPDSGECVVGKNGPRAVDPGDILILVRKRGPFFEAMIRALKARNIPVAGADRLEVAKHIAVNDLVALGRAALLPQDDLTLATVLKTPLIGFDDDDLIALAPGRSGSLHDALINAPQERYRAAAATFAQWREDATTLAPFEFYSKLLGAGGGRRRLVARLGVEANDAVDEFLRLALNYERETSSALTSFLAMVESLELSIKRDMEAAGRAVRVMTVHAAKGLEAKIVFLPDTCGAPTGKHDPKLFRLGDRETGPLAWTRGKEHDPAALTQARAARRDDELREYQRLLYVALTRAEERLYIAGFHGKNQPSAQSWYLSVRGALAESGVELPDPLEPGATLLRLGSVPLRDDLTSAPMLETDAPPPAFATTPAPVERSPLPPLRPSSALAGADAMTPRDPSAPNRRDAAHVRQGVLIHALLQYLPATAPAQRHDAAESFLKLRAKDIDAAQRAEMIAAVFNVLAHPALEPLFGANALAEVDVVATLEDGLPVAGRIDRFVETAEDVRIVDFKTGRPYEKPTPDHLRQLALYRAAVAPMYAGKKIRCYLIFTRTAAIIEANDADLDAALALARARYRSSGA